MICKRCIVSGRVQGVWYRDTTRRKARELGLSGSAVNLPDGTVEVIACGEPQAVAALCDWLWEGSLLSKVSEVHCVDWAGEPPADFTIG
jgi:Acylphosphatases